MKRLLLAVITLLALVSCSSEALAQELRLHFLDVGQGDSVLIQSPSGQNVLYDGGRRTQDALNYLQAVGVESLDLVIASHADADHIAGLIAVVEHYRPRFFLDNGIPHTTQTYANLLSAIERAGSQLLEATGQRIGLGDASLQVLPPPNIPAWEQNNNSVGIILSYGSFSAALTGDAESRQFRWWLDNHPNLLRSVNVYKSSHHGSPHADDELSVLTWSPEVVVIGVGSNSYGHPAPEIRELYQRVGATVYRTDLHGHVQVVATADGQYEVHAERGIPAPAQARAPPPPAPTAPVPTPTAPALLSCIDINTASRERLKDIIHIDEVRSTEILTLRPFRSVEGMTRINGIGPARLRDIQAQGLACVR